MKVSPRPFKTSSPTFKIMSSKLDWDRYLDKLKLIPESPSLPFLCQIQLNHLKYIPFENLDIHHGKRKVLNIEKIYNKIIPSHRGGYCFELNGLLFNLLSSLGFDCSLVSARFYNKDGTYSSPMDHMMIVVALSERRYLVDAGQIDGPTIPKEILPGQVTMDRSWFYRFDINPDGEYFLMRSRDQAHFETYYKTNLKPHRLIEFLDINDKHQDDPESYFRKNKIISRIDENGGRVILRQDKIKIYRYGKKEERPIMNDDEFQVLLEEHFGILPHELS